MEPQRIMADAHPVPVSFVIEHQQLHKRLVDADPTASADLATTFLDRLIAWLTGHHPARPQDLICEAAEDAIVNLIHHPNSYQPRIPLEAYLQMSARGDLLNALRRRERDAAKMQEAVELVIQRGKYQGQQDPLSQLQAAEEMATPAPAVPASVLDGLTEGEVRALQCLLDQERRTAVFAEALGIAHLPVAEQQRIVKKVKDKLKKRLERAGGVDERVP
jgi:DNA-directed RNA polymerase specialized sigma24 family protein